MKKMQLYIHRHYDTIKLIMLASLVLMTLFIIKQQFESTAQASKERQEGLAQQQEAIKDVVEAINTETNSQTEIINRQFRAICILIIETSGKEGLSKLDPIDRRRCENLDTTPEEEQSPSEPSLPEGESQSNTSSEGLPSSKSTPNSDSSQPNNSQPEVIKEEDEPEPSLIDRIVEPVQNLISNVLGVF